VAGNHAYSTLCVPSSATGFVTAAIHLSHDNISPLPDKQLVLELEVREAHLEGFNQFLGSF
jgi:hypothetical protein